MYHAKCIIRLYSFLAWELQIFIEGAAYFYGI